MKTLLLVIFILASFLSVFSQSSEKKIKYIEREITTDTGKIIKVRAIDDTQTDIGDSVPLFIFRGEDNKDYTNSDFANKTLVINFWITSCGPCKRELKRIENELLGKYSSNKFAFISVGPNVSPEELVKFKKSADIKFELFRDSTGDSFNKFAYSAFPRNYVISPEGKIVYQGIGYTDSTYQKLLSVISETIE